MKAANRMHVVHAATRLWKQQGSFTTQDLVNEIERRYNKTLSIEQAYAWLSQIFPKSAEGSR